MIFFPEIGFNDEIKMKKIRMTEMLKLSEEVHKVIIRDSVFKVDEYQVEEIVKVRKDANPLNYTTFRAWGICLGYGEIEIREKYKKIANKVLASFSPTLECFEELVLFSDSYVVQRAYEGCIRHHRRILNGNDEE